VVAGQREFNETMDSGQAVRHDKKTASPVVETGDAVDTSLFLLSGCAAFFTLGRSAQLWRLSLTANPETDRRRVAE
jgi:hypothetical protein